MNPAIIEEFRRAQRILVTSHRGMDGDSAGAALAVLEVCRRLGKTAYYVNSEPLSDLYDFMPGYDRLAVPVPDDYAFDLGFVLDTSAAERVGSCWSRLAPLPRICIDHHEGDGGAGHHSWIDASAASVTIMVAEFIEALGMPLDFDLSFSLYVGLFTDTGAFQQSNTDVRAMTWGARFIGAGVKPFEVATAYLERRRPAAVRLAGRAAARVEIRDRIAWSWLDENDMKELEATDADTEGIIALLRTIGGVRAIVLMRELSGRRIKVNFRAKDHTDVARIAIGLGGGGHRAAAGATVEGDLSWAKTVLLERIIREMGD